MDFFFYARVYATRIVITRVTRTARASGIENATAFACGGQLFNNNFVTRCRCFCEINCTVGWVSEADYGKNKDIYKKNLVSIACCVPMAICKEFKV